MAGIRRASIAVLLSCLVAGASAVRAQDIPLPKPAPQPKDRSAPAPAQKDVPPPPSAQATAPVAPSLPNPIDFLNKNLNPFAHPTSDLSLFDDKQRALVTRVSTYLSGVQTLTGKFVQIGYNRAASLMERMEHEGVVGQANHAGKREILMGGEAE